MSVRIGEKIKEARILAGYKFAKDFAALLNVAPRTMNSYESGERGLSIETVA